MSATEETSVPPLGIDLDMTYVEQLAQKLREDNSETADYLMSKLSFLLPDSRDD